MYQQSTGCGLPAAKVRLGENPPSVSFETVSRPLVIAALDTVPSAATPAFLTACASSKPAVQAWAANSLQVLEFWRIPGKYLSMTVFMLVTAGAFEKNG